MIFQLLVPACTQSIIFFIHVTEMLCHNLLSIWCLVPLFRINKRQNVINWTRWTIKEKIEIYQNQSISIKDTEHWTRKSVNNELVKWTSRFYLLRISTSVCMVLGNVAMSGHICVYSFEATVLLGSLMAQLRQLGCPEALSASTLHFSWDLHRSWLYRRGG